MLMHTSFLSIFFIYTRFFFIFFIHINFFRRYAVIHPEPYQSQFQQRRLGALGIEWRPSLIKYAVGPDFTVGQDYPVVPLVDLEGMVEPQPEFLDAMFWEPEYDIIVSDDNDSEYNVNVFVCH